MPLPYLACMLATAQYYHLPPRVIPSIQAVEGGRPGLAHPNADGSYDLGVMQINTRWIQPLARYARLRPDITAAKLLTDPCFNIAASGLILYSYIHDLHEPLMEAIGHYHSHTQILKLAYQAKVIASADLLFGMQPVFVRSRAGSGRTGSRPLP